MDSEGEGCRGASHRQKNSNDFGLKCVDPNIEFLTENRSCFTLRFLIDVRRPQRSLNWRLPQPGLRPTPLRTPHPEPFAFAIVQVAKGTQRSSIHTSLALNKVGSLPSRVHGISVDRLKELLRNSLHCSKAFLQADVQHVQVPTSRLRKMRIVVRSNRRGKKRSDSPLAVAAAAWAMDDSIHRGRHFLSLTVRAWKPRRVSSPHRRNKNHFFQGPRPGGIRRLPLDRTVQAGQNS